MSELPLTTQAARAGLAPAHDRSPRATRALRALAVLLVLAGGLALLDAIVTLLWQEPISALVASIRQEHLSGDLSKVEGALPTPVERHALAGLDDERARIAFLAGELERHAREGSAVGRIVIPLLGVSYVVVNGTDTEALESGPGIYAETSFPGIPGTTAIAGHRTTYLAPFRNINRLQPGNRVLLDMPYAHFTYTVLGQRVVSPSDVSAAVSRTGYSRLVLSACTPLFSAAKRLLVFARLTRTVPVGAGRLPIGRLFPGGAAARSIETSPKRTPARRGARERLEKMLVSLDPNGLAASV